MASFRDAIMRRVSRSTHLCMFCLSSEGVFASAEHVIPESLGNTSTVLPKGFICVANSP